MEREPAAVFRWPVRAAGVNLGGMTLPTRIVVIGGSAAGMGAAGAAKQYDPKVQVKERCDLFARAARKAVTLEDLVLPGPQPSSIAQS